MRAVLREILKIKERKMLLCIFIFGLLIRFIYFPEDISFGYDQARDAYIALHAMLGDLKVLGPPASVPGLYHGALIYYILGPFYKVFSRNPFIVAAFFRIVNAFGILLIYIFLKKLFKSERISLLAAFLFAISFEQTQFSLFLGHPALGVISVLIFYIGLALVVFSKKTFGLYVSGLGMGLTIQFHFSSIILFVSLILVFAVYKNILPKFKFIDFIKFISILLITLSTYFVAEIKYGFRTLNTMTEIISSTAGQGSLKLVNLIEIPKRLVENNIFYSREISLGIFVLLVISSVYYSVRKKTKDRITFLLILLLIAVLPYIFYISAQPSFYYSLGASSVLIALLAYAIDQIFSRSKAVGLTVMIVILFSNLKLIDKYNHNGTVAEINSQEGMLLTDALKVIKYAYEESGGRPFAVSAVTIPYNINTTWSYLFSWYGMTKYGYLPVWGGDSALGYENELVIQTAQSELPPVKFTIIEPPKGLTGVQIDSFLRNEDIFWRVTEEKRYGEFTIQKRIPKTS